MRVNLTYSVPLDEVETQVADLIKGTGEKMDILASSIGRIASLLERGQKNGILIELDHVRRELNNVDIRLMDCVEIMSGYIEATQNKIPQEVENDQEG